MPRLTVANDWQHLQRYADEIVLCKQCEAAAKQDFDEAQEECRRAEKKLVRARTAWNDCKAETDQAEIIFRRVMDEMTKPVGYDEVEVDGER